MNRLALALSMMAVVAFAFAQSASAALTSVVTDPVGDAVLFPPPFTSQAGQQPAEPFQDIVQAMVALKGGRFTFVVDLAAPIPDSPALHGGTVQLLWLWGLDTDPTTFPTGCPFGDKGARAGEFFVLLLWDGTSFTGIVIDRRPMLKCSEATITSVPFGIKGAEVTLSVDSALLDNPPNFMWVSRVADWFGPLGSDGEVTVDSAPDFGFAPWPA